MKKHITFITLFLALLFIGCSGGGGGSSDSSVKVAPQIFIEKREITLYEGATTSLISTIKESPEDAKVDIVIKDGASEVVVDFIALSKTVGNEKNIELRFKGLSAGVTELEVISSNSIGETKDTIKVNVLPIDKNADIANADINLSANNIRIVENIFAKLEVKSPSNIYISGTYFTIENGVASLYLKLYKINEYGSRVYITSLDSATVTNETTNSIISSSDINVSGTTIKISNIKDSTKYSIVAKIEDLSIVFEFTTKNPNGDSDGDGVLDKDDMCPNTASGLLVDVNGCPISISSSSSSFSSSSSDSNASSSDTNTSSSDSNASSSDSNTSSSNSNTSSSDSNASSSSQSTSTTSSSSSLNSSSVSSSSSSLSDGDFEAVDTQACNTNNGYKMLQNSLNDRYGSSDDYIYFRASTSYPLYFYYLPPASRDIGERTINLSKYTIAQTGSSFVLHIKNSLATGGNFYIKDGNRCFRGKFPTAEQINDDKFFPDKDLVFVIPSIGTVPK